MARKAPKPDTLMEELKSRFEKHMYRHSGIAWVEVQARLEGNTKVLKSLHEMESTGGEPDVIGKDKKSGQFVFVDCSPESPGGRRSTCYDAEARKTRKENAPKASALEMAAAMGIELLTEQQYRELQLLGEFDLKTSQLDCDAVRCPGAGWIAVLRSALRQGVRLSQRGTVVLRRERVQGGC